MKVVINRCYGGFGLSEKAYEYLGLEWDGFGYEYCYGDRSDKKLVECVQTLGSEANGRCAKLKIVNIPDDVEWEIENYDGMESIHELHDVWY